MKTKVIIKLFIVAIDNGSRLKPFFTREEAENFYYKEFKDDLRRAWIIDSEIETEINFSLDHFNIKIEKQS